MKKLRSALALLLTAAMLLTGAVSAEEMAELAIEPVQIEEAEAGAPVIEEVAPPQPVIPEIPEIQAEAPAPAPSEAPAEAPADPGSVPEVNPAEPAPEGADDAALAPAPVDSDAPIREEANPADPPEVERNTPAPVPTAPEIVVAPGWDYDAAARLISIPCAAEDEAVTFEWRFNGRPSIYHVETTTMAADGAESPRAEVGYTNESFVKLPVRAYAEGWHVLYITAVLEDGTQLTSAQAFRLLVRGAATKEPVSESTPVPEPTVEITPEPTQIPESSETTAPSASPQAFSAPVLPVIIEGLPEEAEEPAPAESVEPTEEPESTEEPEATEASEDAEDYGIATISIQDNQSDQNYEWYWSDPMETYLVSEGDGYMAVGLTEDGTQILVKYFDSSYNRTSYKYISTELSLFGGFYAGSSAYYLVFGQTNYGQSDSVEVVRVVKYDKSWNRLSAASLYGANTYIPFDAGNLRMEEYGGYLYIRTSHEMYEHGDGLHHQANLTIQVRTSDMTIVDCHSAVRNIDTGYVSHSFNQFILTDDEGYLVGLDHGDAYPRAIVLGRYKNKAGSSSLSSSTWDGYTSVNVFPLYGAVGDNYTGATVGGLEYSSSHYLVAGSSIKQDGSSSSTRNIFVTATSRSNFSAGGTSVYWITNYPEGSVSASTPQLVKMGSNSFLLLWEVGTGKLSYVFLNGSGQPTGSVYSKSGYLSDCKPIVKGGKAVWFATDGAGMTFYTVSSDGTFTAQIKDYAETSGPNGSFGENNALRWSIDYSGTLTISGKGSMGSNYSFPWSVSYYANTIKKVVIKSGVTDIANSAFDNCKNLTSISIPNGVTRIGNYAFSNTDLKSITIPASVEYISSYAFYGHDSLAEIKVDSGNLYYASKDGVLFDKKMSLLICYPSAKASTSYTVPNAVSEIGAYAFEYATNLKTLVLPKNVTSILNYAFYSCDSLTSITIKCPDCWIYNNQGYTLGRAGKTVVKCYEGSSTDVFAKQFGYTIEYLPPDPPANLSVANVSNGIKVTWDASYAAINYRVEYKAGSGSWTTAGTTTSTSYTWTKPVGGTAYQIRVVCVSADGKKTASSYSATKSITYIVPPALKSATNATTGVKLSWAASAGVKKYRVQYKAGSGSWTTAGTSSSASYTWTKAVSNTTYQFRVCCLSDDGKTATSGYGSTKSVTYIAAPVIQSVTNVSNGIKVTWNASKGAVNYRVEYKTGSGSWTTAGTTTSTSYTWTKAVGGTAYQIRVACVSKDGKTVASGYGAAKSITYIAAPAVKSATNEATGVKVSWAASTGAKKYRVQYKAGSGSWTTAGTSSSASYTWTKAASGTSYQFRVCCLSDDGKTATSGYGSTKSVTYIAAPAIQAATNVADGVKLSWAASKGAKKYSVYYKVGSGDWTAAGATASTSYTWKKAKSGTSYQFRVRCVSEDGKTATSAYGSTKSVTYLAAPAIQSASNAADGVKLSWDASAGAKKYRVEYKTGSGSWATAGTSASTSYTWTGAKSNTSYQFRVCCVSDDGKTAASAYSATKNLKYIAAPKIKTLSNASNGVKVTWDASAGAVNYRVSYKTGSGKWTAAGTTTSTSYTWKKAKNATTYEIRVQCVSSDNKKTTSACGASKSIKYFTAPKLKSVSNASTGIKVSWEATPKAGKYGVYYKAGSGNWTLAGTTASTSYTWTKAKSGTSYEIRVQCVSSDGKTAASAYNTTKSIKYIAAPSLKSVSLASNGITASWSASAGAAKYRVSYKTSKGKWTSAGTTTSNSYTWKKAASGTTYEIRVVCVSSDNKKTTSASSASKSIKYIAAPSLKSVSLASSGIKVSWGSSKGAAKYGVYYKTGKGSWTLAGTTTSTSYTWKKAASGTSYEVRVACVSKDGKKTTSVNSATKSITYVSAPTLKTVSNISGGIQVSWDKSKGAAKYAVEYKAGSGKWATAGTTTSTSYTWKKAKSNTTYQIRVRCVSSDGKKATSAYSATKSNKYIAAPTLNTVSLASNGLKVSWKSSKGAAKYRVEYKAGSGSWTTAGTTTSTSYTWKKAASGTTYQIRVVCVSKDGKKTTSANSASKSIKYIAAPSLKSVSLAAKGVTVSWGGSKGAAKYRVEYKTSKGSWTTAGTTASTSYTWTGAKSGTSYQIRVRCVTSDGKTNTSACGSTKSIKYIAAPQLNSVTKASNGIKVSWKSSKGAAKYRVSYKIGSGKWTTVGTTTSTSYTWKKAKKGTTYQFRVQCVSSDGKKTTSACDAAKTFSF